MESTTSGIVRMRDVRFDPELFRNYMSGTVLDELLCSYKGLPKGVNYMVIGDPGVGKTTIILDLLSNIRKQSPGIRVLFISAEMNEIDLAIYVQRFPKFQNLDILFIEAGFDEDEPAHNFEKVKDVLKQGWDIVAVDSFYELQGIIKEEEGITLKKAESMLLSLVKKQNKAVNDAGINTTFLTIQQVTKSGHFIGSNRLKHSITAMMELRLENPKNIYSDRYVVFSKHRRGDVGVKLYYDLSVTGDVFYNEEKYLQDRQLRKLHSTAASSLRKFADRFDLIFNNASNNQNNNSNE
jgi:predicted ATP-dependent serine protease